MMLVVKIRHQMMTNGMAGGSAMDESCNGTYTKACWINNNKNIRCSALQC